MKQSKRVMIAVCFLLAAGSAWSQQPSERKPEPQKGPAFSASAYAVLVDVIPRISLSIRKNASPF